LEEQTHGPLYLNAGADGFLSKLAEEGEIKIAIQDMLENGSYMNRSLKDKIVQAYLHKEPVNPLQKLSEQEMQVMQLLVKGLGNLEICNQLNLKPTTVTTYKNRLFEKLSVKNLPELIEVHRMYFG
jgi:DNA-binding NarL/FixJ family response regulator